MLAQVVNQQNADAILISKLFQCTDEILDNILCGKKRANTGLFSLFEAQMQLLPRMGDYTVVLDSDMQPRCITRTTKVEVVPFEDVTTEHPCRVEESPPQGVCRSV